MTPNPLACRPSPAPRCRRTAITLLLVLLAAGAASVTAGAGAEQATPDTLSGSAGGASVDSTPGDAPLTARGGLDGAPRADRLLHASLGAAIGVGVGLASREPVVGAGAVLALAVAKELLDDRFDRGDLAAGAAGAGLAWLIVAALTR